MSNDSRDDKTRVDLGDDLIEATAVISPKELKRDLKREVPGALEDIEIMIREGFLEEAKKALRQLVIRDPKNAQARVRLEQIQTEELKQLVGPQAVDRSSEDSDVDPDAVMRELDRDLQLDLSEGFEDERAMNEFAAQVEEQLRDASPQDRLDLGIGFLEMGLHELAIRQFSAVSRFFLETEEGSAKAVPAVSLLAYALIQDGRPLEATLSLQEALKDSELKPEHRLELYYLMARACESLGRFPLALQWYRKVLEIDPRYRDAEQRERDLTR